VDTRSGDVVGKDASVPRGAIDRLAPGSPIPGLRAVVLGLFQKKDGSDGFRWVGGRVEGRVGCTQGGARRSLYWGRASRKEGLQRLQVVRVWAGG